MRKIFVRCRQRVRDKWKCRDHKQERVRLSFYSEATFLLRRKRTKLFFSKKMILSLEGRRSNTTLRIWSVNGVLPKFMPPFLPQNSTNRGGGLGGWWWCYLSIVTFDKDTRLVQNTIFSPFWSILNLIKNQTKSIKISNKE